MKEIHLFWGKQSEFSNFYPCKIKSKYKTYCSMEQFLMYKKARFFNDKDSAKKIMNESNPYRIKQLSRLVKNFDENV